MNYIKNWPDIQQRYRQVWSLDNHDRPVINICAPKSTQKSTQEPAPQTIEERWLNFDWVVKDVRRSIENTYFAAESFPLFNPNLGPDIFGAILGCDITFGENTSWCDHPLDSLQDFHPVYCPENKWLQRIKKLTQMAVDESKGDFLVGITDIHPGMDALVSLRGPENLCMDLYDCPKEVERLPLELFQVYKQFYNDLETITSKNQEGTSNWMGPWHPGRWYATSCDFNCMVSNEIFRKYILPELQAQTEFLDANIYHLDGPGALTQLDDLISIKGVNGIQWVPGAGQKAIWEWDEVLKKCQDAGKMLFLNCCPDDLPKLAEYLKPEGVILSICGASDPYEADNIVKLAESLWSKKYFW